MTKAKMNGGDALPGITQIMECVDVFGRDAGNQAFINTVVSIHQ
jgi:hypothetical protein